MLGTWIKFSGVAKHDGIWVGSPNLGYNFHYLECHFHYYLDLLFIEAPIW